MTYNQPDFTQELVSEADAEQFENEEGISKVYLFTTKKTTPPIYQALAANYNNRLRFAVVKKSSAVSEQIALELSVTKWPTILVNVQNGADEATNITYEGKLKLPELRAFVDQYALDESQAKQDFAIASKQRKESKNGQRQNGFVIIEDIEELKDLILDESNAALVYIPLRN